MKAIIKNTIEETPVVRSFQFETEEKINYLPGQYITMTVNDLKHDFTLSSNPMEPFLQITTKFRPESEYKQALWKLGVGDEIEIAGPSGKFVFDPNDLTPRLFLAGGMGITPFRSMLKSTTAVLLYSVKEATEVVFGKELPAIVIETSKAGRLDEAKIKKYCQDWNKRGWWMCGPAGFTDAMVALAKEMKIPEDRVHSEDFPGY